MTPTQYADKLRSQILELKRDNKPFQIAVTTSHAAVSKRAFTDGRNEQGQTFRYSDKPLYVNPDDPGIRRKFQPKGKTSSTDTKLKVSDVFTRKEKKVVVKKSGEERKTRWFPDYAAFKQSQGFTGDKVNWELTGNLKSDYENQPVGTDSSKALPFRISSEEYHGRLKYQDSITKYSGLSDRYGQFLTLSDSERDSFYDICEKELADFLSR